MKWRGTGSCVNYWAVNEDARGEMAAFVCTLEAVALRRWLWVTRQVASMPLQINSGSEPILHGCRNICI